MRDFFALGHEIEAIATDCARQWVAMDVKTWPSRGR
jgi:hypothetical protein